MLGKLGAERRLDHPSGELSDQPTRARDLIWRKALQGLLKLLRRQ